MTVIPFEPRRFRSTADYYARYRVPYPPALIASVAERVGLGPGDRVLDLGCGPGVLALAFARLGMAVTAMDPELEMLAAARAAAAETDLQIDIDIREGSSYDLGPALGRFRLVIMGRSFHWMDRPATLLALDKLIEPGGAVALFQDEKIAATPDWPRPLGELSERFSPTRSESRKARRAGDWQPHQAVLLDSPFSAVETRGVVFRQALTADEIVGRAFSMSVTSPDALGENAPAFEAELRGQLAALAPGGRFEEVVEAVAILAFRP